MYFYTLFIRLRNNKSPYLTKAFKKGLVFLKHKSSRGVCINVIALLQEAIYFRSHLPNAVSKEGMFHFCASLFPRLVYLTIWLWISVNTAEKTYCSTSVKCLFCPLS